ncbi:MAG: acetylxylan esterase [Anditalea sp.]
MKSLLTSFLLLLVFNVCNAQSSLLLPPSLKGEVPWVLEELEKAPSYQWEDQKDLVWSLKYQGEKYEEKVSEVFAYYASPNTISGRTKATEKFPAIVLIHGGGGTAFRIWALEWAKRGYAAIAMDLGGNRPAAIKEQESPWGSKSTRLTLGGPNQDDEHKFHRLEEDFTEQWQFHSVSNIIRAHSLIRSFQEVDANRTAMTGISWGGYLTNIVAGIDHRFKAAVPVYGCGFLQEGSAWDQQFDSLGTEKTNQWVNLWDPSQYVGNSRMPILFINGTNDFAYFVENWDKTVKLAKDHQFCLIPEMKHSHLHGAEPEEVYNFIKQHLEDGPTIPSFQRIEKVGGQLKAYLKNDPKDIKEVHLVYTKDRKHSPERKWEMLELKIKEGTIATTIPEETLLCYIYLIDKNGNRISSSVIKV